MIPMQKILQPSAKSDIKAEEESGKSVPSVENCASNIVKDEDCIQQQTIKANKPKVRKNIPAWAIIIISTAIVFAISLGIYFAE